MHCSPNLNSRVNSLEDIQKLPLEKLCKDYKIKTLVIFGSFAEGTQTPESDIDVLVQWEKGFMSAKVKPQIIDKLKEWTGREIDLFNHNSTKPIIDYEIKEHGIEVAHG